LYVQENQVRPVFPNRDNRGFRTPRLSNNLNIRFLPQQPQYFASRGRFIVDNKNLKCVQRTHSPNW
jgi:hypothetical protein